MAASLFCRDAAGGCRQIAVEKVEDLSPAIHGLLRPISIALPVEKRVARAVVAVELIVLPEFLEHGLSAVDLIGGRIGVVVAKNTEQRARHFLSQVDRRNGPLLVQILGVVDDDITAPAVDCSVNAFERAGREVSVAAAGAEADD